MEIYKIIKKEEARLKAKECIEVVTKDVATFNVEFERVVIAGFPNCWDFGGVMIQWE